MLTLFAGLNFDIRENVVEIEKEAHKSMRVVPWSELLTFDPDKNLQDQVF